VVVPGPLIEGKFHVPERRPGAVARPRLSERLGGAPRSALTLVSAPAGFGKTTLLTEWLAEAAGLPVAWLSLDARDNDPAVYWTYVVAALRTAVDGVGGGALALLASPQPSIDAALATLINDLHTVVEDVVLVLDDYHVIEAGDVPDGMAFLLAHLPPRLHLVIATRTDPALAVARLRGRGELLEVRAADLRFTSAESAAYLTGAMGLVLTAQDVAALDGRTEGWIAALQLAALSMQDRDDVSAFIAGFAGDDRYIVDYLAEEVLARQPADVRDFLLRTSILDRLSGPLCDAVTGQGGGHAALAALERRNLFLVPLDDRRRWYRYHQLFADVLHAHLTEQHPGDVPDLHRRASTWYEHNDEPAAAIRHALAAGDVERAAGLVELAVPDLRRNRQEATIRGWLDAIPEEVVRVRPVLALGFVGALMSGGEFDGVERRLRDLDRWVAPAGARPAGMVVVDEDELARLPGAIEMYRAALALAGGDLPGTVTRAQVALDRTVEDDHLVRAAASALMGLALWGGGDLEAAHRAYSDSVQGLRRAGHISDVLGCSITLADIRITQGRLGDARRTYEQASRLAEDAGALPRGTADMYVGLAQLACERGDPHAATEHLRRARELGEVAWLPQNPYRWRVAMARVREAEGDLDGALALLDEAQRVYVGDFSPNVRPVPASRARVLTAQGRVGDALAWAREQGLSADDDLSYSREYEHITLARVLLASGAQRSVDDAGQLLQRLLRAAEAGRRTGNVIEILVLQALAHHAHGGTPGALTVLERALTLAEPEGYVRVFAGEGPPMAALLGRVAKRHSTWDYVRRLLEACRHSGGGPPRPAGRRLVEPLSERELDVLRLLGTDLDGPDIARELRVSLNTLRTHTQHIYTKLGVNSRRAAVRRAAELDLHTREH
jgi:LuxR family maltose regulon positive regulatory protein